MRSMHKHPTFACFLFCCTLRARASCTLRARGDQIYQSTVLCFMQTDGGNSFTEPMVIMTGRPEGQFEVRCRGLIACRHAAGLDVNS